MSKMEPSTPAPSFGHVEWAVCRPFPEEGEEEIFA